MKPTRNRVMCPDCGKAKMLFESEKKAKRFIEWNGEELPYGGDSLRPYYCPACCGWHISHHRYTTYYEGRTDEMIENYYKVKKGKKSWIKRN